jgi:hypothetical protein
MRSKKEKGWLISQTEQGLAAKAKQTRRPKNGGENSEAKLKRNFECN